MLRKLILTVILLSQLLCSACSAPKKNSTEKTEIRGVWITNVDSHVLDSRESIAEAMQFLGDHHFNVVFPVVWNDARTLYPSDVMESEFGIRIDPRQAGHDPLAELIEEAHKRHIAVIPWFEYGFSSSHKKDGGHILQKKPEWAARDRDGNLLTKNGFEWMNPYHPEVRRFLLDLVLEVVRNYDVQGVQGDDRLPAQPIEGGYSEATVALYADDHGGAEPPDDYRDPQWQRWRADILNAFAKEIYDSVKAIKPEVLVTWAPCIFPWSYDEYLQDWPEWIKMQAADYVFPQHYRYDITAYRRTLEAYEPDQLGIENFKSMVFPGVLMNVGDYLIDAENLEKTLDINRELGYRGEVFFFYEGLRKRNDRLAKILLENHYREGASLPVDFWPESQ